jgi:hypothetical protein
MDNNEIIRERLNPEMRSGSPPWGGTICYPGCPSEAEISAYLYQKLTELGHDAHLEVGARGYKKRLDIVVFDSQHRPIRVIEVKKRMDQGKALQEQVEMYCKFGVPIDTVCSLSSAHRYIQKTEKAGSLLPPMVVPRTLLKHCK